MFCACRMHDKSDISTVLFRPSTLQADGTITHNLTTAQQEYQVLDVSIMFTCVSHSSAYKRMWKHKGHSAAQLRSLFRECRRAGLNRMQVRCTSTPAYWGNVCWRGRGWEHIYVYCCTRRMKNVSIANILKSIWGRCKGPPSASEWTFGSAGRSRMQWKEGSWGQNVSVRATWKSS